MARPMTADRGTRRTRPVPGSPASPASSRDPSSAAPIHGSPPHAPAVITHRSARILPPLMMDDHAAVLVVDQRRCSSRRTPPGCRRPTARRACAGRRATGRRSRSTSVAGTARRSRNGTTDRCGRRSATSLRSAVSRSVATPAAVQCAAMASSSSGAPASRPPVGVNNVTSASRSEPLPAVQRGDRHLHVDGIRVGHPDDAFRPVRRTAVWPCSKRSSPMTTGRSGEPRAVASPLPQPMITTSACSSPSSAGDEESTAGL